MKLNKWILAAIPLVVVSTSSIAATFTANVEASTVAEVEKQQLRALLTNYDGFSASFAQRVTDSENNLVHQGEGKLVFKQPGKFRWQVSEPDQQLLLSNGETLWWYNPFLEQVSIYDAERAVATTPFALLVSNQDSTWNNFNIAKVDTGFVITPKDIDNSQVQELAVYFDKEVLNKIVITDRTQQVSAYNLSEQAFDKSVARQFNFVIPADVEIDDQRELASN